MRPPAGALIAVLLLAGCGGATSPPPDAPGDAPAPRGGGAEPTAEPDVSPAPSGGRETPSVAAIFEQAAPAFGNVEGRLFLVGEGPSIYEVDGRRPLYDRTKLRGMEASFDAYGQGEIAAVVGRWPDHTFLALNQREARAGSFVYEWAGDRWRALGRLPGYVEDASPWSEDRSLLLLHDEGPARLAALPLDAAASVPRLADGKRCRIHPRRVLAFATGEVVVAGDACEAGKPAPGQPALASFASGAVDGAPAALPNPDRDWVVIEALAGRSPEEVFVAGWRGKNDKQPTGPYLARFDGTKATHIEAPGDGPIRRLALAPDGALWAVGEKGGQPALFRRGPRGGWNEQVLPAHQGAALLPNDVWVRGSDAWWVTADASAGSVLLGMGAGGAPVELPQTAWSEYQSLEPPRRDCGVFMALVGKREAPAADYPELRAALAEAGQRLILVEFQRRGAIYLGVIAYREAAARDIAARVSKALPDTPTKVVCHEPRGKRRLFIFDPKSKKWGVEQQ